MEDDLALYTPPSSCSRPLLISYNHSGNLSLDSWDPQVSDMVSVPPPPKKKIIICLNIIAQFLRLISLY